MEELKNAKCAVMYRPDKKEILIRDLVDTMNDPAMYNKTKRGIAKVWEEIKATWTEDTTLFRVAETLNARGIRTHYWCMVD